MLWLAQPVPDSTILHSQLVDDGVKKSVEGASQIFRLHHCVGRLVHLAGVQH
jgi:hypothetical protein